MKLFRSPWFVGVLAVLAVFMLFYNIFRPQWSQWRSGVGTATSATATIAQEIGVGKPLVAPVAPKAAVGAAKTPSMYAPAPKNLGESRNAINADYVFQHFVQWVDAPRRDPFYAAEAYIGTSTNSAEEGPNPVHTWKLTGIWRQTGTQLAAINGGVYGEGDQIEGWTIEKIDVDQVWFRGTNRLESLQFRQFQAIPPPPPAAEEEPAPTRSLGPKKRPMQEHTVSPQPLI